MNSKAHNSEKGQAIVFLTLGLIIFLGFVALAIDGGMAFADRRHSQNSADASSLAGGSEAALYLENSHVFYDEWNCSDTRVVTAMGMAEDTAITRAGANNFTIDKDPSDHNGVVATCGQFDYGYYLDKFIDITVEISSTTQSNFAQLLFPSVLHNEVLAVTRIRPRQPMVFGNAIVALNPSSGCGPKIGFATHGNSTIYVTDGGIFSNGCIHANGHPTINVTGAGITGHYMDLGGGDWTPAPQPTSYQIPPSMYDVPLPDCSDPAAHNVSDLPETMEPGLYCVSGGLMLHGDYTGTGVTIYIPNGSVKINGGASFLISAPEYSPDPSPAIPGILWYMPPSNHGDFTMNGNSDVQFIGTLLAPSASISLLGTNQSDAYQTQVIGWDVEIGGTADAYVSFNDRQQYSRPTSIELFR